MIRLSRIFTALALLLSIPSSYAALSTEYTLDDLRAEDPTIDEKLESAGFSPEEMNELSLVVTIPESEANAEEAARELEFEVRHRTSRPAKNLFAAGTVLSSVYLQGIQLSYHRYRPVKDKISYHVDFSISGSPKESNATWSFDKHIGRAGFFTGLNAQMMRVTSDLLTNHRATNIPGGGLELGWQSSLNRRGNLVTSVKLGAMVTAYQYQWYYMPEAKLSVSYVLFRKNYPKK